MNAISTPRPALRRVAALGTAAALALCLALPAMLCRAETTALEGTVLTRPALESTLTAEGQSDPLAQALYQGRTLYDSSSQRLELDGDTICSQLSGSVAELYDAGVLSAPALDLAGELMGAEGEASASRSADGTVQYSYFVYSGHLLEGIWQPDLALPVELMIAHPTLPAADPDQLLQAWRAFLGEESGSWQAETPDPDTRLCYSADRQLLLSVYSAEGTLAVRVYSLSAQDWQELQDQLRARQEAAP